MMKTPLPRLILVALVLSALLLFNATEARTVYRFEGWSGTHTDFYAGIWQPNHQVLEGKSPYQDPSLKLDPPSVYPPSGFLPYLPLSWFAPHTAVVLFQLLLIAAAAGTLVALRIRGPEQWVLWLACPLVVLPLLEGNITTTVVLAIALMWRWRDHAVLAASALTAAIAIKLFAAPLLIWLLITRRYRAAAITAAATPVVILGSWSLIKFHGISDYPAVLKLASNAFGADGPFLQGLVRQLGQSAAVALAIGTVAACVLIVLASRTGEVQSLALVSLACLALSPIAWNFYAGILVVPLAAAELPLTAWLILPSFWIVSWWYTPLPYKSAELSVVNLLICAILVAVVTRRRARPLGATTLAPA